jgi:hypothetical protein
MRHVRMLGLCLVAVFAIAAVAATAASASSPEWGQCYAKEGGKYANSNCTQKAKKGAGTYEWRKGTELTNTGFSGAGGTGILISTFELCEPGATRGPKTCAERGDETTEFGPISVECTSEVSHGETSGKSDVKAITVEFRGCVALGSIPCSNTTNEGEIITNELKGELGYINKGTKSVGVRLTPNAKNGEFAKFSCAIGLTTVVGVGNTKEGKAYPGSKGGGDGIISPIVPVDQMTDSFTQEYTVNEGFENIPNKFEGKPLSALEAYLYNTLEPSASSNWSKSGETIVNVNTPNEEGEIKA